MPPRNRPSGIYPIGPGGRRRSKAREIWVVTFDRIHHVRKALQRKVLGRNSPVFWQMRRQCCAILRYSALLPLDHSPPARRHASAARRHQPQVSQRPQVCLDRPPRRRVGHLVVNLAETSLAAISKNQEDAALPLGQVAADSQWRVVAAGKESHHNISGLLLEVRLRLPRRHTPVHDFLRASAPLLNQLTASSRIWNAWPRSCRWSRNSVLLVPLNRARRRAHCG